jgi:peptidoglycan-associated lipoprotein
LCKRCENIIIFNKKNLHMNFKKLLIAVPLLSLTACSCGNKVADNANFDEISGPVTQVDVVETSTIFAGKVADRVFFATDKSTLNHESQETLSAQADLLRGKNFNVVVEGHCDERGPREYNLALGERRANAAKDYLCHKGVDCDKISTVSYGKERPEVQGHDPEAWAQNRRAVTLVQN